MKYVRVIVAHCTKSYTERTCILAHFYIRVSLRIETKNKNKTRRKKKQNKKEVLQSRKEALLEVCCIAFEQLETLRHHLFCSQRYPATSVTRLLCHLTLCSCQAASPFS